MITLNTDAMTTIISNIILSSLALVSVVVVVVLRPWSGAPM